MAGKKMDVWRWVDAKLHWLVAFCGGGCSWWRRTIASAAARQSSGGTRRAR